MCVCVCVIVLLNWFVSSLLYDNILHHLLFYLYASLNVSFLSKSSSENKKRRKNFFWDKSSFIVCESSHKKSKKCPHQRGNRTRVMRRMTTTMRQEKLHHSTGYLKVVYLLQMESTTRSLWVLDWPNARLPAYYLYKENESFILTGITSTNIMTRLKGVNVD